MKISKLIFASAVMCVITTAASAEGGISSSGAFANKAIYQTPFTRFTDCDVKPRIISSPGPRYPEKLRKAKVSGEVVVEFLIGTDGRTKEIQVTKASDPAFIDEAVKCIMKWRFSPAKKDGKVVVTAVLQPLKFEMVHE